MGSLEESSAFAHAALSQLTPAFATEQIYIHVEMCYLILCFPFPTHKSPSVAPMKLGHSWEVHGSYGTQTAWDFAMRRAIVALISASRDDDSSAVDSGEEGPTYFREAVLPFLSSTGQGWFWTNDLERFPVPLHHPQAPRWLFRD